MHDYKSWMKAQFLSSCCLFHYITMMIDFTHDCSMVTQCKPIASILAFLAISATNSAGSLSSASITSTYSRATASTEIDRKLHRQIHKTWRTASVEFFFWQIVIVRFRTNVFRRKKVFKDQCNFRDHHAHAGLVRVLYCSLWIGILICRQKVSLYHILFSLLWNYRN